MQKHTRRAKAECCCGRCQGLKGFLLRVCEALERKQPMHISCKRKRVAWVRG